VSDFLWFFFKLLVWFWSFPYVEDGILEFPVWFLLKNVHWNVGVVTAK
jgi:hypothetical protein